MAVRGLSRLVTYAVFALAIGVVVLVLYGRVGRRTIGEGFRTYAMLRDASVLPIGSRVMIAGVQVGEIQRLSIQGNLARVDMRLRNDVVLWDDATARKRLSGVFGDAYIELTPGGPLDPAAGDQGHRRLRSGEPILHVIEAQDTDRVLRTVEHALPRVEQTLDAANRGMHEARQWVGGTATQRLREADQWIASGAISQPLTTADDAMSRLETWTGSIARATDGSASPVNRRLDQLAVDIAGATEKMRNARQDIATGLGDFRTELDQVDTWLDETNQALTRWGGDGPGGDAGAAATAPERNAFGNLVRDPELGESLDEGTDSAVGFTSSLGKLKTWVGLRAEYNILAGAQRFYLIAEMYGKNDRFYVIELEKGPLGDVPLTTLADGNGDPWVRSSTIQEGIRFTAQWGKKMGPLRIRFGLKESTFGFGADALLLGGSLRLETDIFELTTRRVPRLKVAAALELFHKLYVLGGVDDVLREGGDVPIQPWPAGQDVPTQFREVRFGRDLFAGLVLRFDERDINSILLVYGAVLSALL